MPFVVSGSIDRYHINFSHVQFLKKTFERPFVNYEKSIIAESKWLFWTNPKIIIAGMTKEIEATYVEEPLALGIGVYAIYTFNGFDPKFILALLNSKYLSFFLKINFKDKHLAGGYLAINKSTIEQLPVADAEKQKQKPFIGFVDKILTLTKDKDYLDNSTKQAKVHDYEKQIDQLVYKLYGLTPEEIKIVELNN